MWTSSPLRATRRGTTAGDSERVGRCRRPAGRDGAGRAVGPMTSGWRLELGDLADALGVRQSSVSQWERGTTSPTTRHLLALLGLLGAVLVRLLVGEDGSSKEAHASSGAT